MRRRRTRQYAVHPEQHTAHAPLSISQGTTVLLGGVKNAQMADFARRQTQLECRAAPAGGRPAGGRRVTLRRAARTWSCTAADC